MKLHDHVIVLTGATSGLGLALAERLQAEGCRLVVSSQDGLKVRSLARRLKCLGIKVDVTKERQVQSLATKVRKLYGHIDIWINNAGVSMLQGEIEDVSTKEAHRLMEVNYFGTLYGSREAVRIMKLKRAGTIVNILSKGCLEDHPNAMSLNYYASKAAADALTRGLQKSLVPDGITVIGVYPGGIKTKLHGLRRRKNYHEFMEASYVADKVVSNLQANHPKQKLVIWQPQRS